MMVNRAFYHRFIGEVYGSLRVVPMGGQNIEDIVMSFRSLYTPHQRNLIYVRFSGNPPQSLLLPQSSSITAIPSICMAVKAIGFSTVPGAGTGVDAFYQGLLLQNLANLEEIYWNTAFFTGKNESTMTFSRSLTRQVISLRHLRRLTITLDGRDTEGLIHLKSPLSHLHLSFSYLAEFPGSSDMSDAKIEVQTAHGLLKNCQRSLHHLAIDVGGYWSVDPRNEHADIFLSELFKKDVVLFPSLHKLVLCRVFYTNPGFAIFKKVVPWKQLVHIGVKGKAGPLYADHLWTNLGSVLDHWGPLRRLDLDVSEHDDRSLIKCFFYQFEGLENISLLTGALSMSDASLDVSLEEDQPTTFGNYDDFLGDYAILKGVAYHSKTLKSLDINFRAHGFPHTRFNPHYAEFLAERCPLLENLAIPFDCRPLEYVRIQPSIVSSTDPFVAQVLQPNI
jgi:hypothetical protein